MHPLLCALLQKVVSDTLQHQGQKYLWPWLSRQSRTFQMLLWLGFVVYCGLFGWWLNEIEIEPVAWVIWALGGFLFTVGLLNYFVCPEAMKAFRATMKEPE